MNDRLPAYDPTDPAETAVIRGLVRSWPRRATVRREEPELDGATMDELFDLDRADYPDSLLPCSGYPAYAALDEDVRVRIGSWAWIAYNKNVMDIEQYVVTPGFGLLFRDAFGTGLSDTARASVLQAMVDEEYHTLMHLNASALVRRRRGWPMPDAALPDAWTVRRHRDAVAAAGSSRDADLATLAFATVSETSIGDYLTLIADDETIQPLHKATVALHRRDERAHASVTTEMVAAVHEHLGRHDRDTLAAALHAGVDAFTATDLSVWEAILRAEHVAGAEGLLRDVAADPARRRLLQDCSAIDRLLERFGAGTA